jgi:integrase
MPRTTTPLSDTQIKQAKPRDKEYNLADGNGLSLRIKPNGAKLWLFNYSRPFSKKRNNLGLGQYPALTLLQARAQRHKYLELLAQDVDPQNHRAEQERQTKEAYENTFLAVASKWFDVKKTQVTPDYADDIWRSLEAHIFPSLGSTPIHLLKAREAISTLEPLAAQRKLETVKRLCQRLNAVMVYAMNIGLIEANTLSGISNAFEAPKPEHMPTIKPEELPELMLAIANASITRITRCLLEWSIHIMARPKEIAHVKWAEIDFDNALWTIPDHRMKNRKEQLIPLSRQAIEILEIMKPISSNSDFVFPSDRSYKKPTNSQTANAALKRMGFKGRLTSHGLRSIASTALNDNGFDKDLVEKALSHVDSNSVRAAYNRAEYLERRREMMQWWSDYIEEACLGNLSITATKHSN